MSMLSCVRGEIRIISYLLPAIVRHLKFPTYLDVELYSLYPGNTGKAVGSPLLSIIRAEIAHSPRLDIRTFSHPLHYDDCCFMLIVTVSQL